MKKVVLLTGGNGFIGQHTISKLIHLNYEIHLVSRYANPLHLNRGNIYVHSCNLFNAKQLDDIIHDISPSHLLHFAWYVENGKFWTAKENIDWVVASLNLIKSFQQAGGKRIVMAGTCAEYDWNYGYCIEDVTPIVPSTLYGISKASLNAISQSFSEQYGMSTAWGRIFHIYGPGENMARFIPSIINQMLKQESVQCSHGEQIRDFMHVNDVAQAFVKLLDSNTEGAINIASGVPIRLKDIVQKTSEAIGFQGEIYHGSVPPSRNEPHMLVADVRNLKNDITTFSAEYNFEDGIIQTIDWWKKEESDNHKKSYNLL